MQIRASGKRIPGWDYWVEKKRKEESTKQHTGACRLVNNQLGLICGKQNEDTPGVSEGENKGENKLKHNIQIGSFCLRPSFNTVS